jgi:hypothetical protein
MSTPQRHGGLGIAGGDTRLAVMGSVVAGVAIAAFLGAAVVADVRLSRQPEQSSPTTCEKCQGELADTAGNAEAPDMAGRCPHCRYRDGSEE